MSGFRKVCLTAIVMAFAVAMLGASGDTARFDELGHHRIICVCGCNQMLLECNHVGCTYSDKMRQELSAAVQNEPNDDAILQSFVREYGTTVLAAPSARGFDRVAWIMPFAVFFAATFGAAIVIRKWKERQLAPAMPSNSAAFDPYREQARRDTEL
ncbi:MAG TPA: cytochrome c-type biogenesis protein CcmH [Terriglobales bacterium]|nr:cytochrome c-type biogenesis protein CcmH [Terriglobales bacterium]